MPDVFISYTRGDRKRVALIAEALEAEGFKVWWDAAIKPGKAWHDMLRKQLQSAHCVIVCWSRASAKSDWVLAEATQGYNQQKLVPTTLQACDPPMPFNMVQSADLTAWRGEPDDEYWVDTLNEIRRLVEKGRKLIAAAPPPGEAHGAELTPAPRGREPASRPPQETLPPPRAPRYQASRTRKKMGPRPSKLIAGALVMTAALTGALWAGPQAFDYIKLKLNTPPAQTAAIDAAPADPAPLAVEPLPAATTDVQKTEAPALAQTATVAPPPAIATTPPARPPVTAPPATRPPVATTPVVDRPPVVAEPPKVTVTVNDMEGCMQQIAKACGASTNDFRVDGQFSVAERRLMRTPLFPDGARLTEVNLAACKAGSTRRSMNSDDGRAACAAIAPPAADPDATTPPVRLTPTVPARPSVTVTPQPQPQPTRPPVTAAPTTTAPPTASTPTVTGVITRPATALTQRAPTTATSTKPAVRLQQPLSRTLSTPSTQPPSGQQIR